MPEFTANPTRVDPYKTYKFKLMWDGKYVAGISEVSPLKRTTEVVRHRSGGDPSTVRKSVGQTDWDAITLSRGVTHDTEFEKWANKIWSHPNSAALGKEVSLGDFRKDIVIELYNEAGQKVIAYKCFRCWPSEFVALPGLNANASEVAIQSLTLQTEGWERDESVQEPKEPTYTDPAS